MKCKRCGKCCYYLDSKKKNGNRVSISELAQLEIVKCTAAIFIKHVLEQSLPKVGVVSKSAPITSKDAITTKKEKDHIQNGGDEKSK